MNGRKRENDCKVAASMYRFSIYSWQYIIVFTFSLCLCVDRYMCYWIYYFGSKWYRGAYVVYVRTCIFLFLYKSEGHAWYMCYSIYYFEPYCFHFHYLDDIVNCVVAWMFLLCFCSLIYTLQTLWCDSIFGFLLMVFANFANLYTFFTNSIL